MAEIVEGLERGDTVFHAMGISEDWLGESAPCWICAAVERAVEVVLVVEDGDVAVLVSPLASNPGHLLVVPRQHVRDIYSLPESLAGPVLITASRVARAAKLAFAAGGVTLRQNNDADGGQEVFHFHLHVIPRFRGDAARFAGALQPVGPEDQQEVAMRIRSMLPAALD